MLAVVIAEGVAVVLLAVLVLGLLRSHALILKALHELGAGLELERDATPDGGSHPGPVHVDLESGVVANARRPESRAAEIVGTSLDRQERTIEVAGPGRRTLLAFLSSGCSVCQTFWEELRGGDAEVPGQGRLVVVTKGPEEESVSTLRQLAGDSLDVVQSSAGWTDYDIPGSPYFVYVEDGVVTGEGSSTTWSQVRGLMSQAVADSDEGDSDERDSLPRMDRELLGSGIHPGHASLYESPDSDTEGPGSGHPHQDH
jgi:hypothetical protein